MAADLERLAEYHRRMKNEPRARLFEALAEEERTKGTPETISEIDRFYLMRFRMRGLSVDQLISDLGKSRNFSINDQALGTLQLLDQEDLESNGREVKIGRTRSQKLGINENFRIDRFLARLEEIGGRPMTVHEVLETAVDIRPSGLALRLYFATKPLEAPLGDPVLLNLYKWPQQFVLETTEAAQVFSPSDEFAFAIPDVQEKPVPQAA